MFKVNKFEKCHTTGFVTIEIEVQMWKRPARKFSESFTAEPDAKRRIRRLQTDYMLFTLENIVSVCRECLELNITYNTVNKKMSLEKCTSGLHYLQSRELETICDLILKINPLLDHILPPDTFYDYDFLYKTKIHLINFCTELSKTLQQCPA